MSEEKIKSWQVLREDGHNCAWVNGRYIGTITDKQVEHLRKICPTSACTPTGTHGAIDNQPRDTRASG